MQQEMRTISNPQRSRGSLPRVSIVGFSGKKNTLILLKGINITAKYFARVMEVMREIFSGKSFEALKKAVPLALLIVILV